VALADETQGGAGALGQSKEHFLQVVGLGKSFTRQRGRRSEVMQVLDDINLEARRSEFITVIGPSGCGKSTLLNCIAGLTSFDAGSIMVDGNEVNGPGFERAVVFQHASLLPWRTIKRNVSYGLELRRDLSKSEISARADYVIELVGLEGFASHYPHEVSGGMQQRTNLARALAVDPALMLMDEPFGALDALTKEMLQDELSALATRMNRTTVFITHDIGEAVFLGDVVYVMSRRPGRIEARIPVPLARPRERAVTTTPEFEAIVTDLRRRLLGNADTTIDFAPGGVA
jgi:NitT/TauT family transport system ATP-binding protein